VPGFHLTIHEDAPTCARTVAVHGELDLATSGELADAIARGHEDGAHLVVDMSECSFVDSSGMRSVIDGARTYRAGDLTFEVVCPPDNYAVTRVIDLIGLRQVVSVLDARSSAPRTTDA
jgi:anti-anti-sigma factor